MSAVDLQFNWSDRAHYNLNYSLNSLRCCCSSSQIDQHIWMESNHAKKKKKTEKNSVSDHTSVELNKSDEKSN